jgi:poly(3-hydroxybutyrate) depolymerase
MQEVIKYLSISMLVSLALGCARPVEQNLEVKLAHDGSERRALLHLPPDGGKGAPIMFVLHGYGGEPEGMKDWTGLDSLADLAGMAVCYPEGLMDSRGMRHWNAGFAWTEVDDVAFLDELVDHLAEEYSVDVSKAFVCGMSNGGFMAYTLACERSERYCAVASVTGTMSPMTWSTCELSEMPPTLQFSGLKDNTVPFDGRVTFPQFAGETSTLRLFESMAQGQEIEQMSLDTLQGLNPGWGAVVRRQFRQKEGDLRLELWTYENGPHTWFQGASERIVSFFAEIADS